MKAFSLAVVSAVAATASGNLLSENQYQSLFSTFVDTYDKSYEVGNVLSKYETFKSNLDFILAHNAQEDATYTLGMNQFGDMTSEEFVRFLNMDLIRDQEGNAIDEVADELQDEYADLTLNDLGLSNKDWSSSIRNAVKNQASCGSCWAFATIGSMEYRYAKSTRSSSAPNLSEQQLVDCDNGNNACSGGLMSRALTYVKANGVCSQAAYKYTAKRGVCASKGCSKGYKPRSIGRVSGSEANLVQEINNGPVPVAVAAGGTSFQFYRSGILNDASCPKRVDHAVIAVGYGNASGKDYIKIRNSWGAGWGENGYIRVAYNRDICGIGGSIRNGYAHYPVY